MSNNFKIRLNNEKEELDKKLDKLNAFIILGMNDIDDVQKALLKVQASAMKTYSQCLEERIERL